MFNFLKKKIKAWKEKTKKNIEEKAEKQEKKVEKTIEKAEKQKKEEEKPAKKEEKKEKQVKQKEPKKEEKPEEEKKGFFKKIKSSFSYKLTEEDFNNIFNNLEEILLENNTALETIDEVKKNLKEELQGKEIKRSEIETKIQEALKQSIEKILIDPFNLMEKIKQKQEPFVILFVGINGSGKTTTIAKISNLLQKNKISTVLAAADTFRAASIEQLTKHAQKLKTDIIKQHYGADPTAVAYDAIEHAKARKTKVVLVDTAGRMHTKENLIREMEKINRVCKPDLKIFVAESITGNDATEQAKIFNEAISIDAVILTKADVDEKGGAALSISNITKKPILFLGTGQEYKNLEPFNKEKFLRKIL